MIDSSQNTEHIPGLAEMAIQQTFERTTKPRRGLLWFIAGKRVNRTPNTEQNHKPMPVNKPRRTTKLETVNKTSRVQVEFTSLTKLETGLQWVENLIHILTPRLLVLGFVLSMVDLLTHGSLLNIPYLVFAWAIIQAMAVDATLPNMWRLAFTRFDERRYVAGSILLAIGIGLGLVVFAALSIQFLQQAENITLDQTMSKLGVNPELLTYVRSSSVVLLAAVLSVLNRTKLTASHRTVNQDTKPMNTELPQTVNSEPHEVNKTEQDTEPLQFASKPAGANGTLHVVNNGDGLVNSEGSKQQRIRALLEDDPDTTVTQIVQAVGVSKGYASQQRAKFYEDRGA